MLVLRKRKKKRSPSYIPKWLYCLKIRSAKWGVIQPDITAAFKRRVLLQFKSRCFRCGSTYRLQHDHVKPLCMGYPLIAGNCCILCRRCNMEKAGLHPRVFYADAQLARLQILLDEQLKW